MISRRGFVSGLIAAAAAPAIVRSTSLMQVRGIVMPPGWTHRRARRARLDRPGAPRRVGREAAGRPDAGRALRPLP
jgi:hypothetical protein